MRVIALLIMVLGSTALADDSSSVSAADEGLRTSRELELWASSAPQARHLAAGGAIDVSHLVRLEVGGWGLLDSAQPAFLRGGWVGARLQVLDRPSIGMWARLRAFAAQPQAGDPVAAGGAAEAWTVLQPMHWLTLVPGFELSRLGSLSQGRLSAAYRFHAGAWTVEATAGAQGWVRRGEDLIVAPLGALALDWKGRIDRVDVGIGGGVALARDGSFLVDHPLELRPSDDLQPWIFARISITPQLRW